MVLVKAVERLSAARDLTDIIEIVRSTARAISGADGVCFVLRDGELCHYIEEDAIAPLWKGKRFPLTACISGWCMLNDAVAVIPDIYADARIPHDAYRPTFVKSLVMVPVRTTKPIAAIGCYWAATREFAPGELALIEALGRSASAAIAAARLRDTLRESEGRLALALDAGHLGAWELNFATRELTATAACKAIFGKAPDETCSPEICLALIHPDDREPVRLMFETGQQTSGEFRVLRPDGERHIELHGRVVLDANGSPKRLVGVVRDVTGRYQAKERLDRARAELARGARLNDLGQMASALAHELSQPLAAAANYMHAAERLLARDTDQAKTAISKAEAQFQRAKQIIERIRSFVSKGQPLRGEEDVHAVISEALEMARANPHFRGIPVRCETAEDLPRALIDKVQIQQVLLNLLRNAFEALEGCTPQEIAVSAQRGANGMIEIRVADSGPGLDAEIATHLFQPFHTTKENGMGVGLSLCRKIVEGHEGRLWHEPGHPGAVFCFTIPAAA